MADYTQFLTRAVAALDPNTPEQRQALYDRARKALIDKLRAGDPALSSSDLAAESAGLEASIRRVEADAVRRASRPQSNPADEPDDAPAAAGSLVAAGWSAPESEPLPAEPPSVEPLPAPSFVARLSVR